MTSTELKDLISSGETSTVQFKETLENKDGFAAEMIAMAVKQGADKRRLTENGEQIRLFQQSGLLYADEMLVPNTSASDINMDKVQEYVKRLLNLPQHIDDDVVLKNLNIIRNDRATLAGLLFFGKNPQQYRPVFCIKAVAFYGNSIGGTEYKDSVDIAGTIPEMFEGALHFCRNNLHHTQQGQSFNSEGKLEISEIALKELLQNALTHRDYSRNAPIRLMIFDNRLELTSPGALPNSLTIENIKMGNSVVRNNLIVSYSSKLMEYRGLGSGIIRALSEIPDIEFENDRDGEQFIVRIERSTTR